jgi:hypothetical protein
MVFPKRLDLVPFPTNPNLSQLNPPVPRVSWPGYSDTPCPLSAAPPHALSPSAPPPAVPSPLLARSPWCPKASVLGRPHRLPPGACPQWTLPEGADSDKDQDTCLQQRAFLSSARTVGLRSKSARSRTFVSATAWSVSAEAFRCTALEVHWSESFSTTSGTLSVLPLEGWSANKPANDPKNNPE